MRINGKNKSNWYTETVLFWQRNHNRFSLVGDNEATVSGAFAHFGEVALMCAKELDALFIAGVLECAHIRSNLSIVGNKCAKLERMAYQLSRFTDWCAVDSHGLQG